MAANTENGRWDAFCVDRTFKKQMKFGHNKCFSCGTLYSYLFYFLFQKKDRIYNFTNVIYINIYIKLFIHISSHYYVLMMPVSDFVLKNYYILLKLFQFTNQNRWNNKIYEIKTKLLWKNYTNYKLNTSWMMLAIH